MSHGWEKVFITFKRKQRLTDDFATEIMEVGKQLNKSSKNYL